jgi:hypothetical protein
VRWNTDVNEAVVPEITAVSKPKRSPPRAAMAVDSKRSGVQRDALLVLGTSVMTAKDKGSPHTKVNK